jgi:hypothetical protein
MYVMVDELTGVAQRLRTAVSDVPNRVVACPPTHPPTHFRIETDAVKQRAVFTLLVLLER